MSPPVCNITGKPHSPRRRSSRAAVSPAPQRSRASFRASNVQSRRPFSLSLSLFLSREWPPADSFAFAESDDIEGDARQCDICLVQLASYSAARECDVCSLVCCGNCALEVSSHGELLVRCTICENDAEDEDETLARARAFDWSEASEPESP